MIIRLSTQFFETVLVILITSLISIQSTNAYERLQEIKLYTGVNNSGDYKVFTDNNLDLRTDPIGRIAKSHCVIRGLWRIGGIFSNNPTLKFIENAHGDGKSGPVCGTWNTDNRTAQYRSIKYVGAPDLDTPAISLYTKTRFYSEEELYFEGNHLRLPAPISFSSFGFTGKDNWLIYKNTKGDGASECLKPTFDPIGDHTVTFNTNKTMVVGAITRGCDTRVRGGELQTTKRPSLTPKPAKGSAAGSPLQKYNNFVIPLTSTGYLYIRMNSHWVSM